MLPAASVAVAVIVYAPSDKVLDVMLHAPVMALATTSPTSVPFAYSRTRLPASAVPVKTGVVSLVSRSELLPRPLSPGKLVPAAKLSLAAVKRRSGRSRRRRGVDRDRQATGEQREVLPAASGGRGRHRCTRRRTRCSTWMLHAAGHGVGDHVADLGSVRVQPGLCCPLRAVPVKTGVVSLVSRSGIAPRPRRRGTRARGNAGGGGRPRRSGRSRRRRGVDRDRQATGEQRGVAGRVGGRGRHRGTPSDKVLDVMLHMVMRLATTSPTSFPLAYSRTRLPASAVPVKTGVVSLVSRSELLPGHCRRGSSCPAKLSLAGRQRRSGRSRRRRGVDRDRQATGEQRGVAGRVGGRGRHRVRRRQGARRDAPRAGHGVGDHVADLGSVRVQPDCAAASAVPVKTGVVVGVASELLPRPLSPGKLVPAAKLSLAAVSVGAAGVAGGVVSTVIDRPAESADVLPARSVAVAVIVHAVGKVLDVMLHALGLALATTSPTSVPFAYSRTRLPASAVPVKTGVVSLVSRSELLPRPLSPGKFQPAAKLSLAAVSVGGAGVAVGVVSIVIYRHLESSEGVAGRVGGRGRHRRYLPSDKVLDVMPTRRSWRWRPRRRPQFRSRTAGPVARFRGAGEDRSRVVGVAVRIALALPLSPGKAVPAAKLSLAPSASERRSRRRRGVDRDRQATGEQRRCCRPRRWPWPSGMPSDKVLDVMLHAPVMALATTSPTSVPFAYSRPGCPLRRCP